MRLLRAKDAEPGALYQLRRRSGALMRGVYYKRAHRSVERPLLSRLRKATNPRTDQTVLLRDLEDGELLFRCYRRFRSANGSPVERSRWVALSPETQLRQIQEPPGYGKRKR